MGLITWIIFGALAGWFAGWLAGGDRRGCIGNVILGIVGAVVGGFLMELLTGTNMSMGFNLRSFIVAVIGAIVVLFVVGALRKRR
jgi:uncharacterized membrane protein YeaQ/YmgE (transglycosylase-associated protein family)